MASSIVLYFTLLNKAHLDTFHKLAIKCPTFLKKLIIWLKNVLIFDFFCHKSTNFFFKFQKTFFSALVLMKAFRKILLFNIFKAIFNFNFHKKNCSWH